MTHGTINAYDKGCRCVPCCNAKADYAARRNAGLRVDDERLRDLLIEVCPDGLTDDCPARRGRRVAA